MPEKIEVGTIGYGFHGRDLMTKVIAENSAAQVVGIVDVNPERKKLAKEDDYSAYSSSEELLARHPNIKYIAMAVNHPQTVRALTALAEAATKYGLAEQLAVTIEKPIASNLRQAKEATDILRTAFKYGGVFNRLEYPSFRYALEQIASGKIGDIQAINDVLDIWLLPPSLDPWKHLPDPNNTSNTRGNALLNGFHCAGTLAVLAGLPENVSAHIKTQGWYPGMEVDDTVEALVRYPTLDARYHCEWGASPMFKLATQIVGKKGTIVSEEWGDVHEWKTGHPATTTHFETSEDFTGKHHSGNFNYHDAILRYLTDPANDFLPHSVKRALEIGLVAQAIVEATYISSDRKGDLVTMEETVGNVMPIAHLQETARLALLPSSNNGS